MSVFEVSGPEWLEDGDAASCETCGHWSSFSAGFKYNEEGYVQGWYDDQISCVNWTRYDADEDTVENFREFLAGTDYEEARDLLHELDRLGL